MELQTLALCLRSSAIFRNLLRDDVVQGFCRMMEAQDAFCLAEACGAFASALYAHTGSLSRYVLDALLEDENCYVRLRAQGIPVPRELESTLLSELRAFSQLAALTPQRLENELAPGFPIPQWQVEPLDFQQALEIRMSEISSRGYGIFARAHAFFVQDGALVPVRHPDRQQLAHLSGYRDERRQVIDNTLALLEGRPASNVLLYGDAGTGKSSTVKAIANEYKDRGLRLVEVQKNQLYQIPDLMDSLTVNPLKFILYIDDLSFSSNDSDFAALKAILEGSVAARSGNLAVYATSNRRHLIRESFSDREGDDIHRSDTMEELRSLSARFGLTVVFSRPEPDEYRSIVLDLARQYGVEMEESLLMRLAEAEAIRKGGRSPRAAKQLMEQIKAGI